jgi:hypothetical protein
MGPEDFERDKLIGKFGSLSFLPIIAACFNRRHHSCPRTVLKID